MVIRIGHSRCFTWLCKLRSWLLAILVLGCLVSLGRPYFAQDRTLSVTINGTGTVSGPQTASGLAFDCPPTCSAAFSNGATINLTAMPSASSSSRRGKRQLCVLRTCIIGPAPLEGVAPGRLVAAPGRGDHMGMRARRAGPAHRAAAHHTGRGRPSTLRKGLRFGGASRPDREGFLQAHDENTCPHPLPEIALVLC